MNLVAFTITATIIYVLFFMDDLYDVYTIYKKQKRTIEKLEKMVYKKGDISPIKKLLIETYCWDIKNNKPHDCLIKGKTRVNCEWFDEDIKITEHGLIQINILKKNNKEINKKINDLENDRID